MVLTSKTVLDSLAAARDNISIVNASLSPNGQRQFHVTVGKLAKQIMKKVDGSSSEEEVDELEDGEDREENRPLAAVTLTKGVSNRVFDMKHCADRSRPSRWRYRVRNESTTLSQS